MILKRLKRASASPGTALALMALVAAASAAVFAAPGYGFPGSPWFLGLAAVCAAALAHAVYLQAVGNLRRLRAGGDLPLPSELGRWAAPAFHLGLLLVVAAGLAAYGFQKRGFVQVIEGETLAGRENDFLSVEKGPLAGRLELPFGLKLRAFKHAYWDTGEPSEIASRLSLVRLDGDEGPAAEVAVNRPLRQRGLKVYQSPHYGYSVSLRLESPSGREAVTHFLLDHPARPGLPASGGADFPTTDYGFRLAFRPDRSGGSPYPVDPSLSAVVTRGEAVVYRGPLPLDRPVQVGRDILTVAGIRSWSGLIVVEERSAALAAAGFVLVTAGALGMFALPQRRRADG